MSVILKDIYIKKLPETVKKCNNTIHRSIKMKHIGVKPDTYASFQ